jgi:hypothetical protein
MLDDELPVPYLPDASLPERGNGAEGRSTLQFDLLGSRYEVRYSQVKFDILTRRSSQLSTPQVNVRYEAGAGR